MTSDTPRQEVDQHFRRDITLRDGTRAELRMLQPQDRDLVARGFEKLSRQSRYQRFLTLKKDLSARELEYLVDIDGQNHVAIGAAVTHGEGRRDGIGVARFIRYPDEPTAAEAAVTVVDAYQGQGLGRKMLRYLVRAARERGIETFRADTLHDNVRMRALFDEIGPTEVLERAGAVVSLDIPLEQEPGSGD